MRVLVVHNRYRSSMPSGENNVVDAEVELLRSGGVDVHTFIRSSDEITAMPVRRRLGVISSPFNGTATSTDLRSTLDRLRPDIVHLHNPYPLVSPVVIDEARHRGAAVVATLHNFRLACMNGLLFRDGKVCTDCEGTRVPWPGVLHSCYRDSRAQSTLMAAALVRNRARWDGVSRFLAVSPFVAERARGWGLDDRRIVVKPNATADTGVADGSGSGYLFAGRLSREKGVDLLLDAWVGSGLDGSERLVVVGDGPMRAEVERRAATMRSVTVVGQQSSEQVRRWRAETAVAVFPSVWFETMSSAPESFAAGRPVVSTSMGALGDVVDDAVGWSAAPSVQGVAAALRSSVDQGERRRRGAGARQRFVERFAPDVVLRQQREIYDEAIADRV